MNTMKLTSQLELNESHLLTTSLTKNYNFQSQINSTNGQGN